MYVLKVELSENVTMLFNTVCEAQISIRANDEADKQCPGDHEHLPFLSDACAHI